LEHYNTEWNAADLPEVSSASSAAVGDVHPAGNSACARSVLDMQTAALRAAQTIDVSSTFFTFMQQLT